MLLFLALRQPANAGLNLAADDRRTEPEPILPKRRIRKHQGAPCTQRWYHFSFIFEFGQQLWKHEW